MRMRSLFSFHESFFDSLLTIRGDKERFSSIFTNILKRSHHFVSSKFFLCINGMQEKSMCQYGWSEYLGALSFYLDFFLIQFQKGKLPDFLVA